MFVPVVTPPPPSPRVQALGQRIAQIVLEQIAGDGPLSRMEVQQAFRIARTQLRSELGGSGATAAVVVALGLGVLALAGLTFVNRGPVVPSTLVFVALAALGLMHAYRWMPTDTTFDLRPAWPWAAGYALMGLTFLGARWLTVPHDADDPHQSDHAS